MKKNAYFISRPRRIDELQAKDGGTWRSYEVVATVGLTKIDFENFATDLLADRAFLENAHACGENGALVRCLRVTGRGSNTAILVLPDSTGHVALAALERT